MKKTPQKSIQEALGGYLVGGKSYPRPLPQSLQSWYCYTGDGGHCIVCVLTCHYQQYQKHDDFTDYLIPVPVKTVLRQGYQEINGYIVVDLPYDQDTGLVFPDGDDEW